MRAVRNNEGKIIVTGDLAEKIIYAHKKKSTAKKVGVGTAVVGAGVAVAGLLLAPFTYGKSISKLVKDLSNNGKSMERETE